LKNLIFNTFFFKNDDFSGLELEKLDFQQNENINISKVQSAPLALTKVQQGCS